MKIYTKGGDQGETGLLGGGRVAKDHARLHAYGTLDELNAVLGMVLSSGPGNTAKLPGAESLLRIQGELFQLGSELATPRGTTLSIEKISDDHVAKMETEIDAMEAELPPLKTFILPGGDSGSAVLHLARTVSRRAEREVTMLHRAEPLRPEVLRYINRLSDYFFVTARYVNFKRGQVDVPWIAPR